MKLTEGGPIDFLSIIHVINNIIIGTYLKDQYLFVFLLGVLWEIIEYKLVNTEYIKKIILKYYPIKIEKWEDLFNKSFDLIFNMIGYYIGNQIIVQSYNTPSAIFNIVKYITLVHVIVYLGIRFLFNKNSN